MKNTPPALRAVYIILVPIVLLIILLNSGYLQRLLTAATLHGETMKVVDYNYFYFDYYNSYLDEHATELNELGYNPEGEDSKQYYDANTTWKEFFQREAEANAAETAYYCDLAEATGYTFTAEELAPVEARLAENRDFYTMHNLGAKNYYISYYGSGMTKEIYIRHLTEQVKAQAYKHYLAETMTPDRKELDAWLASHTREDYKSVNLQVITLDALPDRETGDIGTPQLNALQSKMDELVDRHKSGTDFDSLQQAFSTCRLGDAEGWLDTATVTDLPDELADRCLKEQELLKPGDTFVCMDEETGIAYYAVLKSFGGSGQEKDARAELNLATLDEQEAQAIATDYAVIYNTIGMMLATG